MKHVSLAHVNRRVVAVDEGRSFINCKHAGRVLVTLALVGSIVLACEDTAAPGHIGPEVRPDVREWVTGEAVAHLDSNGNFILPEPEAPGAEPIVSEDQAVNLALAFIRTFLLPGDATSGPEPLSRLLEREHGRPVRWHDVVPRPELTYYAGSAYEELPAGVPLSVRRAFGPSFLMPLEFDGIQVAIITIAAHSTDTSIDEDGTIVFPTIYGGEFTVAGTHWSVETWIPPSPEEAVRIAAMTTGARIVRVPRLTRVAYHAPSLAAWEIVLEHAVTVRVVGTEEIRSTDTIYMAPGPLWKIEWFLPRSMQPVGDTISYTVEDANRQAYLRFRDDIPVMFDAITPLN